MLGTYFTFVLLLFILLLTGGILAYSGDLKSTIKTPLLKWEPFHTLSIPLFLRTVAKYDDSVSDGKGAAYKKAWNSIQKDVSPICHLQSIQLSQTQSKWLITGNISFVS